MGRWYWSAYRKNSQLAIDPVTKFITLMLMQTINLRVLIYLDWPTSDAHIYPRRHIAAGVDKAFQSRLFVRALRKTAWAINTKLVLYSSRSACIDPEVKGQGHKVRKTVMVAQLLVTTSRIPHTTITNTPLWYLRPLPAWVCMSIRLPTLSSCCCYRLPFAYYWSAYT